VSVARRLAGGRVKTVRGYTASLDRARAAPAAWSCQLGFDNGIFASLVYSGYAHFDSDELMGWIGEMGQKKDASTYWTSRRALRGDELALKRARNYGGESFSPSQPIAHQHFGFLMVSCDRADLRPMPHGVMIYADEERRFEPLPAPAIPRAEVIDELYAAIVEGREPLHSGEWATATMEVCLALLRSAHEGREVIL
jgi:phthalate 4,5-cis-dihydrodiol dehydrogenase